MLYTSLLYKKSYILINIYYIVLYLAQNDLNIEQVCILYTDLYLYIYKY